MNKTIEHLVDPFLSEREPFFQVYRNDRRAPRSSTISVALPHLLAMAAILVLTAFGS